MISKEEAINILDDFLENEYNVDSIYSHNLKAHRIFIDEKELYWRLVQSDAKDINKEEGNIGGFGGGVYFVDKNNGEIFETGSPFYNYDEEFTKFKRGEKSQIKWTPKKIGYLSCEIKNQFKIDYLEIKLKCKYSEKEKAVREFFQNRKGEIEHNLNPKLINKAFDLDEGELILGLKGNIQEQKINLIQKQFTGGLDNFRATLWNLKKWVRINNKKVTDNYWIEIEERDFDKEFDTWNLKLNLEFK